jgi:murein tripeptide amidase MpaA
LIDAGVHAREWIAPATALYLIRELVQVFEANQTGTDRSSDILKYDWIVIPTLNPDGYIYSFWHNRMWRKNRQVDLF